MSTKTIKLKEGQAANIVGIASQQNKESPQVQENILSLRKKISDAFTGEQVQPDEEQEIEVTASERVSVYRVAVDVLTPKHGEKTDQNFLIMAKIAGEKLGFIKQLRETLKLDKEVEKPNDFKFDEEFEIAEA
jgi:hypothetical protein